jgi:hypothetical protein
MNLHHFCGHQAGFEIYGPASIREIRFISNEEMEAGKTVNVCFLFVLIFVGR